MNFAPHPGASTTSDDEDVLVPANLIDSVCDALPPELIAAAADLAGEGEDLVRQSITAFVPVALAAFSGHAHQPGQRIRFHADVTGPRVDRLWIAPGPIEVVRQRLPSTLQAGRQASLSLFGPDQERGADALAVTARVRATSAAMLIDLSCACVLSHLKRIVNDAHLDAHQLVRALALQYTVLAARTDPAIVEGLGHPSVAAWLSACGADAVTRHPMAPAALAKRRARQATWSTSEVAAAVLAVSIGVAIAGAIASFHEGSPRVDTARDGDHPAAASSKNPTPPGRDARALSRKPAREAVDGPGARRS